MTIKTRFAPSPTGYPHIGGIHAALFSWAFARHRKGEFLLRIGDTDLMHSTAESVNIILDGMKWVGPDYDNADNVVYQTRRSDRYREVITELLERGHAYYCYCSKEELEAMREKAEKEGTATYDRCWHPEEGKAPPEIPADMQPVVRFKTPLDGVAKWTDLVKGKISIPNEALNDLTIARADGTPTYNFCVVVDDYDTGVTHVIRGDDHVNNTPRQINISEAIGAILPEYGHLPMILNEQGKKISKRSGDTVVITDFGAMGILPGAMLNYLARLSWAHGGDEFFTMEQFIEWFDLKDVSPSPSHMDLKRLYWINGEHIKITSNDRLVEMVKPRLALRDIHKTSKPTLEDVLALVRDRAQDLNTLTGECLYFYVRQIPAEADVQKHWDDEVAARMLRFAKRLEGLEDWNAEAIHNLFKPFCDEEGIKMGKLGTPLRLAVCDTAKTSSVDATLALISKEEVLKRIRS